MLGKMGVLILSVSAIVVMMIGCVPGSDCLEGKPCTDEHSLNGNGEGAADAAASAGETAPACTVFGRAHIGLGGEDLAAKTDAPMNGDRSRAKPYSALVSEYTRVLGTKPRLLDQTAGTFGVPNDRWYLEPLASAVFVNTAYDVAFDGCLDAVGDRAAPTADAAKVACKEWTRRFWSRDDASPEQIAACVSVALESPSTETPRRRWAYACASVLTATGFLMY